MEEVAEVDRSQLAALDACQSIWAKDRCSPADHREKRDRSKTHMSLLIYRPGGHSVRYLQS